MASSPPRLGVAATLAQCFGIWFRNWLPLTHFSVLCFLPSFALAACRVRWAAPNYLLVPIESNRLTATLTYAVLGQLRSAPVSGANTIRVGLANPVRVIAAAIAVCLAVGCGLLCLVVPGILLAATFYVVLPVIVMERLRVIDSLRRSQDLVRGERWRVLWLILIVALLEWSSDWLGLRLGWFTAIFGRRVGIDLLWVEPYFTLGVQVLLAPLGAIAPALVYFTLRTQKEGGNLDELAKVFE